MASTMSPSGITPGQIGKVQELLGAALRKSWFPGNLVQKAIERDGDIMIAHWMMTLREYVELASGMTIADIERSSIDRCMSHQEMLNSTGLKQITDPAVVEVMPTGNELTDKILFFVSDRALSVEEVKEEYKSHHLYPIDPYSLIGFNKASLYFTGEHVNCTIWHDQQIGWCSVVFRRMHCANYVIVTPVMAKFEPYWWFAGSRIM